MMWAGWSLPRSVLRTAAWLVVAAAAAACADPVDPGAASGRTWRMGFGNFAPRPDFDLALQTLALWSTRADAAIMHEAMPWRELLGGADPDSLVDARYGGLAQYYRGQGFALAYTVDPTDGLSRGEEAPDLRALGRSIREPAVQAVYRRWGRAVLTRLRPEYLGLAAETNLIREAAPSPVYEALVVMANQLAAELAPLRGTTRLYISVQVDVAWGRLGGSGSYQGVDDDLRDFGGVQALGLSSYPYFGWTSPDDVPLDYYSRLQASRPTRLPVLLVEGGWTSEGVGAVNSAPALQARWIRRQARLLDSARAVAAFQLTFTDFDAEAFGFPPGSIAPLFAFLGMVDVELRPKPALAPWDSLFALPLRPSP